MDDSSSVLARVKNRLAGSAASDQTQVIPDFSSSILFGPPTQKTRPEVRKAQPLEAVRLPQLQLDESDFVQSTQADCRPPQLGETQVIKPFASPSQSSQSDRAQHTRQLESEVAHVSLTDEENDMNEAADITCDSSVQKNVTTKAELERIDRELSEQKRLKSIKPAFTGSDKNPVQDLLDAFDSDQQSDVDFAPQMKSSPNTSPMKDTSKPLDEPDSESDFESDNVIDIISKAPGLKDAKRKRSPIDEYARRLKDSLVSSPTRAPIITLEDSDHDSENDQQSEDDVPKLSKEKALLLKQKFSKRHLASGPRSTASHKSHSNRKCQETLFANLRRANAKQLADIRKANPDSELIEEIEKEEEEMGNLLEREMERARRIRKKEKSQEKAKLALMEEIEDADYNDDNANEVSGSDVPDSDLDSELDSQPSSSEAEVDQPDLAKGKRQRARQVVTTDEESAEESGPDHQHSAGNGINARHDEHVDGRNDDSYMFGGTVKTSLNSDDEEDPIMHIHSDLPLPESSVDHDINHQVASIKESSPRLFSNLAPRTPAGEHSIVSNDSQHESFVIDSFQEIIPTQASEANLATQVDGTFPDQSTQVDSELLTQTDTPGFAPEKQSIEFLEKNTQVPILADISESESEQDEEEMKRKLALYEAKIRKKEVQSRKRRKEMERRGLKGMLDGEAEESEDEWKGVGGADMELSDQADSEDEKMIDNTFNIDLNDEEVRRKFMEQYQIKDRAELEKLIDDVKNHKLTKRARANRFDIELSDEEDEILMAYRRQKLEEQKKRLAASQKLMKNSKNEKFTAFFESIDDEATPFIFNEDSDSDTNHDYDESQESSQKPVEESQGSDAKSVKKKIVIEEAFVQRQLSFLSKTDDDYAYAQEEADRQHGVEDLSVLKSRCLNKLYSRSNSTISLEESKKRPVEDVATDEDDDDGDFNKVFKKPSVVSSFKAFQEKKGVQVSTNSFSGVTVNKSYKTAAGSKASITYMSKKTTKSSLPSNFKSSRLEEIERQLDLAKNQSGIGGSASDLSFS